MYPILFSIGPIKVESYYVIWAVALCLMVVWTRARALKHYGISFNDASDILFWVMLGVFAGATIGGYFDNWSRYAESPEKIFQFWNSGLSSGPGFIGGGLAGMYKIRKLRVSLNAFAESASLPCAFMLFIGRWGCFLNGCCQGVPTSSVFGVTFQGRPPVAVYPSQAFESIAALCIGLFLLALEKKWKRTPEDAAKGAKLWPMFLILYGAYRMLFDFLRAGDRIFGFRVGQYTGLLALLVGIVWLFYSRKALKNELA